MIQGIIGYERIPARSHLQFIRQFKNLLNFDVYKCLEFYTLQCIFQYYERKKLRLDFIIVKNEHCSRSLI